VEVLAGQPRARSLADVFDLDVVAKARRLQLVGKLFLSGDGVEVLPEQLRARTAWRKCSTWKSRQGRGACSWRASCSSSAMAQTMLDLQNKSARRKRGRAAESGQGGGQHATRGRGRESAAALPAAAEREPGVPGQASSEEEGDDASWVTDTSCGSDSDGGSSGNGSSSKPSGARAGAAMVSSGRQPCRASWLDWDCN
jgi:hypothetical protein